MGKKYIFIKKNHYKIKNVLSNNTVHQARSLVQYFSKSAETYTYVRKNLLLFQLEKTLFS